MLLGKITKMTTFNTWIRGFSREQIATILYGLNSGKSKDSPQASFYRFSRKKVNLGSKMKVLKFLRISNFDETIKCSSKMDKTRLGSPETRIFANFTYKNFTHDEFPRDALVQ